MSTATLHHLIDAVFGNPYRPTIIRVALSDKQIEQLKTGSSLQFKAGNQTIHIRRGGRK